MADTTTANYGLVKPEVGASNDTWGNKTNSNWDVIDVSVKFATDTANAAMPKAGGAFTGPLTAAPVAPGYIATGIANAAAGITFGTPAANYTIGIPAGVALNVIRFRENQFGVTMAEFSTAGAAFFTPLNVSGALTQAGNQVWHAGNLVPGNYAPLASPALTGTPTAPTAALGTNTQQVSTTAFVAAAIAALVNSAPGALDQLNELATALGNDPNFATTITNALAGKQALIGYTPANKAGDTFTGAIKRDANFFLDFGGPNPSLTVDANDAIAYDRANNKYLFIIGNTVVASIDSTGTLRVLGGVIASTAP
jgi:hypothetical protein